MSKKRKQRLIDTGIYVLLFTISVAVTFFLSISKRDGNRPVPPTATQTAGEKLIQSLIDYEGIEFDAEVDLELENDSYIGLDIQGLGKVNDIENIALLASYTADMSGVAINGDISYFGETMTFTVSDKCSYYLEQADLLSFINMLPEYGLSLEVPEALKDINQEELMNKISAIEESDRKTIDNGNSYFYIFTIGEGKEALPLYVITDLNDNFLGLRTDTFIYKGTKYRINVSLEENKNIGTLENPLTPDTINTKYFNFAPAFQLFDALYKLTSKDQIGALMNVDLQKLNEEQVLTPFVNVDVDLNADLEQNFYSLNASVSENGNNYDISAAYINETVYAALHNVKVKIEKTTIDALIQYVMSQMSETKIKEVTDKFVEAIGSMDINTITQDIYNTVQEITLTSEDLGLNLDFSSLGLDYAFKLGITFINKEITKLTLGNLAVNDFVANVTLDFHDYIFYGVNDEEYVAIEPSSTLVAAIMETLTQKQFRMEIAGNINDTALNSRVLGIDGGFQFSLEDKLGYGEMTFVDKNNYNHNVKADVIASDDIKFAYNDTLFGKFSTEVGKELMELVSGLVEDPSEHFLELFGDLLEKVQTSPLYEAVKGNYGLLLDLDYISNLQISDTALEADVSLKLIGIDETFHLTINYHGDSDFEHAYLDSLSITDLVLEGKELNLEVNLKPFDEALNATRLTEIHSEATTEYLDFSNVKILLELGLNTSRFNYYHFSGALDLEIKTVILGLGGNALHLPLDVEVLNNKGNVNVAVNFTDIPVNLLTPNEKYASARNRSAQLYYDDDLIYVYRSEEARRKGFLGIPTGNYENYEIYGKYDLPYFKDNIIDILLKDVLSLSDLITSRIEPSEESGEEHIIHYERLVSSYIFDETNYDFHLGLDLNELTGMTIFSPGNIVISGNEDTRLLDNLTVSTTITVGIKVGVKVSLDLLDDCVEDIVSVNKTIESLEAYVSTHSSDPLNVRYEKFAGALV